MPKSNVDRITELMRYAEGQPGPLPTEVWVVLLTQAATLDQYIQAQRDEATLH